MMHPRCLHRLAPWRLLFAILVLIQLTGCATVFDARHRPLQQVELDESLSWWRLPDRSGLFEPRPVLALQEAPEVAPPPTDLVARLRAGFTVPDLNTARVRQRQTWYAKRPELVQRIVERSNLYLYHILDEAERRGLPSEVALIPFIESGFDPDATSSAEAAGLWQFIPSTALKYNLKLTTLRDERRDVIASTRAAMDYLEFLHGMFGDWQLAFAAYNWGENAVARAVERNRSNGRSVRFEHITMPEETMDYLPKLQAIKNILRSPEAFQIGLPTLPNRPYFTAINRHEKDLRLVDAAKLSGASMREVLLLNAGTTNRIIRRGQPIVLPLDRQLAFETELDRLPVTAPVFRR
jgi:membrane-bound lytic murein transglycosylase D